MWGKMSDLVLCLLNCVLKESNKIIYESLWLGKTNFEYVLSECKNWLMTYNELVVEIKQIQADYFTIVLSISVHNFELICNVFNISFIRIMPFKQ